MVTPAVCPRMFEFLTALTKELSVETTLREHNLWHHNKIHGDKEGASPTCDQQFAVKSSLSLPETQVPFSS